MIVATDTIRVLLADDHALITESLTYEIERTRGLTLVGAYEDGQTALEALREHEPDVALLDIVMPGLSGFEVMRCAREEGITTRFVLFTASVGDEFALIALASGASGYLNKTADWPEIEQAIRDAAEGKTVASPALDAAPLKFTKREREVLSLTASDLTAREVGVELALSDRMVKKYLSTIYRKLGVHTKHAAVMEAKRRGLI